jgi:phosphoribosylformimino-5-aminoimidazole carboxamide ribotide isomerase
MRLIPAIDILNGQCVRLVKGDYNQKTIYNENPLEVAKSFEANGLKYVHLVDLDGAKSNGIVNYKTIESIAKNTSLSIDFGGGIKSRSDLETAFNAGAKQVTIGSLAVKNPELVSEWITTFGADKIILGADIDNGNIATNGWKEKSNWELFDFLTFYKTKGIETVICTDISKDGMLQGSNADLYQKLISEFNLNIIASGGVSSLEELKTLRQMGCDGAIIGKAIYEGKITLKQLQELC